MSQLARRGVMCVVLCAVTLGLLGGTAVPATPDGYHRVHVEGTPVSIAVPDDWQIQSLTRATAKKLLKENPDLADAGTTVEALLSAPLSAGVDLDGDDYADRYLAVELRESTGMPSPAQLRAAIGSTPGVRRNLTVERTTVARKPALVTTYTLDITRDDGVPETVLITGYVFVPRGSDSVALLFSPADEFDVEFADMVDTMIKSVKVQKR
jgi:hypothetical protein